MSSSRNHYQRCELTFLSRIFTIFDPWKFITSGTWVYYGILLGSEKYVKLVLFSKIPMFFARKWQQPLLNVLDWTTHRVNKALPGSQKCTRFEWRVETALVSISEAQFVRAVTYAAAASMNETNSFCWLSEYVHNAPAPATRLVNGIWKWNW